MLKFLFVLKYENFHARKLSRINYSEDRRPGLLTLAENFGPIWELPACKGFKASSRPI